MVKNRNVPDEAYQKFRLIFDRSKQEELCCSQCSGLKDCRLHSNGWRTLVSVQNGVPVEEKTPCAYKKKEEEQRQEKMLVYSSIPARLNGVSLNSIQKTLDKESNDYRKVVYACLGSVKKKYGIYLSGDPGVGKTYLMTAFCNDLVKGSSPKTRLAFVNIPEFLGELKGTFNKGEQFAQLMESIKQVDILVLDDLGSEQVTSWSRDQVLFGILDYRMNQELFTCFTSNIPIDKLTKIYCTGNTYTENLAATRFVERVKALSGEIKMNGESRRHA